MKRKTLIAGNADEAQGIRKALQAIGAKFEFHGAARKIKPVHQITDRQKRRRARKAIPKANMRRCIFCGSSRNMRAHHINGNESDLSPANLDGACHACNTKIGFVLKKHRIGRRVDMEYKKNPEATPARNLAQWMMAVKSARGESDEMTVRDAIAMIRATSPKRRSYFAEDIWKIRRAKGTDTTRVPF